MLHIADSYPSAFLFSAWYDIGVMSAKLACQRGTIYVEDTCYLGYIVFNILHTVASGNGILVFVMGGSSLTFLSSKFDILKFCKIMSFED